MATKNRTRNQSLTVRLTAEEKTLIKSTAEILSACSVADTLSALAQYAHEHPQELRSWYIEKKSTILI